MSILYIYVVCMYVYIYYGEKRKILLRIKSISFSQQYILSSALAVYLTVAPLQHYRGKILIYVHDGFFFVYSEK
jgi:hypothetical protein